MIQYEVSGQNKRAFPIIVMKYNHVRAVIYSL